MSRLSSLVALGGLLGALATGTAAADQFEDRPFLELGLFAGAHKFSPDSELGVADEPLHPTLATAPLIGSRLGFVVHPRLTIEAEAAVITTRVQVEVPGVDDTLGIVLGWRAQAAWDLRRYGRVKPFILAGAGGMSVVDAGERLKRDTDLGFEAGGGIRVVVSDRMAVRAEARWMPVPSATGDGTAHDFEFHAGLVMSLAGVSDDGPTERDGSTEDFDGDGVPDVIDTCLRDPEDKDGFQDGDGCPDRDDDADGVPDDQDRCPHEKENRNGVDDDDGCVDTDPDGDGVYGTADACPSDKEDLDSFKDDDGCPELDDDADGVPDALDRCHLQPETWNGLDDEDGCPDVVTSRLKSIEGAIAGLTFEKDKDVLKPEVARTALESIVEVLEDYPTVRIEITGHTAADGDHDMNVQLSKRRAEAVKAYLVSKKIAPERLQTVGYGPDRPPVTPGAQARRIEIKIIVELP